MNNFLSILLSKRIATRKCQLNTLKVQPLFNDFDWEGLIDFKIKAPFIPKDLREWSNNLKNLSNPFEIMITVF
jgi:hypothetical protein